MDIARWGLPLDHWTKPIKVMSIGGRFDWNDQGQTPNAHLTIFDFDGYQLFFESCNLVTGKSMSVTNAFHTTEGVITDRGFTPYKDGKRISLPDPGVKTKTGDIFRNYIECIRSRKVEDQLAPAIDCHRSSALCHLGAICYRLGEVVPFDKSRKAFGDNKEAFEALQAMEERMKSRNVKIDASLKYRVGPTLTFDPTTEKFVDNDAANKMLTRNYRKPFVVPDKVV